MGMTKYLVVQLASSGHPSFHNFPTACLLSRFDLAANMYGVLTRMSTAGQAKNRKQGVSYDIGGNRRASLVRRERMSSIDISVT